MRKAIILFWLGAFCFLAGEKTYSRDAFTIFMTQDGFEPRELTITLGDTITFVNKDDTDRWPASNLHPTHDIYPEFDSKQGIVSGSLWSFTFDRAGEWRYHDHIFPHLRGKILVVGFEAMDQNSSIFSRLIDFVSSLISKILGIFPFPQKQKSSEPLVDNSRLASQGDTLRGWDEVTNHDEAHLFGVRLFEGRGVIGISLCNPSFAFGCYHGFTDAALSKSLDPLKKLARACESIGAINSGPWASCIHGIGHGVATYFNTVKLDEALDVCGWLQNGAIYCYDGVFMEFATNAPPSFYEQTKSDPLYPCTVLKETYRGSCARNQPAVLEKFLGMHIDQISSICLESQDENIRYYCIDAIGISVGQKIRGDADGIIGECGVIKNEDAFVQCVSAAAGELAFQNYKSWESVTVQTCNSLSKSFQKMCNERVLQIANEYGRRL